MATVVLCWELGGGAGHLALLAEIATATQQQGHRVCLISRNLCLAGSMPAFTGVELFQAPITPRHSFPQPIINYAGVLRSCGFQTAEILSTSLQAWMSLLELLKADVVITGHAPTPMMAAKLMSLPAVMTGNGFDAPPLTNPMPSLLPWQQVSEVALREADDRVLQTINQVVSQLGFKREPFTNLAAVFAGAPQWVQSAPELDHYQRDDAIYTQRKAVLFEANEPVWPKVPGANQKEDRVFVYFDAASWHLNNLIAQLRETGLPVLAVIPGAPAELVTELQNTNIQLAEQRVNMREVAQQCDLIINHAGHTSVLELLFLGKPCILLPDNLERKMTAYRAGLAGLAFAGATDPKKINIQQMIAVARRAQNIRDNAQAFQRRYADSDVFQEVDELLLSCLPSMS